MDAIRNAANSSKEGFQKLVGNEPETEELSAADSMRASLADTQQAAQEAMNDVCPELSYKQRLIGFVVCASCGYVLSFGSFLRFGAVKSPPCASYSIGALLALW